MTSPFPGMDPYLENPSMWRGVHHWFITASAEQLQPQLTPRGYYIDIESRVWLESPERSVYPDLSSLIPAEVKSFEKQAATAATAEVADVPVRIRVIENEVREDYLQIYEQSTNKLITGIEFVSPSNKSNRTARKLYLKKRKELIGVGVNVVEMDLLRGGKPIVRLPASILERIPGPYYLVNIVRTAGEEYEFHPIDVRRRLPRVGVPLKPGEPDVVLDLQAARDRVYEAGAYRNRIDYNRDPVPPLPAALADWSRETVATGGSASAN